MADQLPLHEELAIQIPKLAHIDVFGLSTDLATIERQLNGSSNLRPLLGRTLTDKRKIRKISSQTDATANDDVRLRTIASHPLSCLLG
jgi:predicted component of type VI protein secretion system